MGYKSPIPPDEDKQCCECKHWDYDSMYDMGHCNLGNGYGNWSIVEPAGTCEEWENKDE